MKKTIYLLSALVLAFGCTATKKQSVETKLNVSEKREAMIERESEETKTTSETTLFNKSSEKETNIDETVVRVFRSVPDGAGVQFPVMTEKADRKTGVNQKSNESAGTFSETSNTGRQNLQLTEKSKTNSEFKATEKSESKKESSPVFNVFLLILIVCIVVCSVLKKKGAIK